MLADAFLVVVVRTERTLVVVVPPAPSPRPGQSLPTTSRPATMNKHHEVRWSASEASPQTAEVSGAGWKAAAGLVHPHALDS
jgi:hypothetical protein